MFIENVVDFNFSLIIPFVVAMTTVMVLFFSNISEHEGIQNIMVTVA